MATSADEPQPLTPPRPALSASDAGGVVIVSGMSGAGKTTALKVFEDLGYECVDNLPLVLLHGLIGGEAGRLSRPIAIGIDVRTRDFDVRRLLATLNALRADQHLSVDLLFLDATDDILARRYTETRRRHPIGGDLPVPDGIALERQIVAPLRDYADLVIDTSVLPVSEFRRTVESRFSGEAMTGMTVFVTSFGFRNGLPREADLVFDVRFLRNPHYVPELQPLTGRDPAVGAYVAADPDYQTFYDSLTRLLAPLIPRYQSEGKRYLTIAIGCTGGKHRSVFLTETLAAWLRDQGSHVVTRHRDAPAAPRQTDKTIGDSSI